MRCLKRPLWQKKCNKSDWTHREQMPFWCAQDDWMASTYRLPNKESRYWLIKTSPSDVIAPLVIFSIRSSTSSDKLRKKNKCFELRINYSFSTNDVLIEISFFFKEKFKRYCYVTHTPSSYFILPLPPPSKHIHANFTSVHPTLHRRWRV